MAGIDESADRLGDHRDQRFSQSLERGLAILTCFSAEHPSLGIADIAMHVGLSRSTTHRYVVTLVELGYLEQDSDRKYRLGLRVTDLGASALMATGLAEHAEAFLKQLRRDTNLTAGLAILDGTEVLYVQRIRGSRQGQYEIDGDLHFGSRLPAYCTAAGKLLLANLDDAQQKRLLADVKLTKCGPGTITSKTRLREELACIQARGFATAQEERAAGTCAVAVPVRLPDGEVVAAVNVVGPASEISVERIISSYLTYLRSAANGIAAALATRQAVERE